MNVANGAQSSSSTVRRSPNDIRVREASPDVINNLLASLSNIDLPSESDTYTPLIPDRTASLRSPPQSIRSYSSQRPSAPTSVFSRDPSSSFQDERPPLDSDSTIGEVSVTHVAEPPTIKTSRPPSGYSKLTAPKSSRKKSSQPLRAPFAQSPNASAPPSRQRTEPTLPQLPEETSTTPPKTVKSKKSTDETRRARALIARSQRDSLQVTRSREAKGKQRAQPDSPNSPLYSPLPTSYSQLEPRSPYSRPRSPTNQRLFLSEHVSPAARSPVRTAHGEDDLYTPRTSSRPLRQEGSNDNFVIVHRKKNEPPSAYADRRKVIPSRSSSVGRAGASPPKFGSHSRRSSRRSSLRSQHQSPETVPEERNNEEQAEAGQTIQEAPSPTQADRGGEEDLGLGEENSVIRRIKQLRAAKEAREKANPASITNDPNQLRSSSQANVTPKLKPPDTSNAAKQVQEARTVRERRITIKDGSKVKHLETPTVRSPGQVSPTHANFSRPQPTSPRQAVLPSPSRPPPARPDVQPEPVARDSALSRSASRIKRWSNPDLAAAKNSYQRHSRNDSNKTDKAVSTQPVLPEERTSSADSITDFVQEILGAPRLSQRISPPGETRVISFSEVGDPAGHAVFCCIGMGLTRYVMAFYEELATSLKLRLITLERPGIGDSTPYDEPRTPLYWPDDIRTICNHLSIQSFSLVAHSAGAIYALATALKMPSRVRGRIHVLSPWIPPSQLTPHSTSNSPSGSPARAGALPRSQRFLRYVPTPFLKLGSSTFAAKPANSKQSTPRKGSQTPVASGTPSMMTSPRPSIGVKPFGNATSILAVPLSSRPSVDQRKSSIQAPHTPRLEDIVAVPSDHNLAAAVLSAGRDAPPTPSKINRQRSTTSPEETMAWQKRYDAQLTAQTWELATRNANPAVDLLVCLERHGPIGFRYRDVPREIVIRHGSKDSRVPLENVKWLGTQVLQKAEVRILEGEGHGLMANAGVMASVLAEVGKEAEMGDNYGNLGSTSAYNSPILDTGAATF